MQINVPGNNFVGHSGIITMQWYYVANGASANSSHKSTTPRRSQSLVYLVT